MDNLIFSLNATVPVFLTMVVGWLLKQKGMLTENFCTVAEKFNFNITLPALLFKDIAGISIREAFDPVYTVFCAGATTICFFGAWLGAKLFMKEQYSVGAFVQVCYRSSAAVLGIAFIQNIERNEKDFRLVELIVDIARYLKVPVVAEGVETENQLRLLRDAGCDLVQGYYFSRPLPPDEFERDIIAASRA